MMQERFTREEILERYRRGRFDFRDLDLSSIDLSGVNLDNADFQGAYLDNANLSNSRFRKAKFGDADLSNTVCISTDFKYADLAAIDANGADFTGAKLVHADLRYSSLTGSNLEKADLSSANLHATNLSNTRGLLNPTYFMNENFQGDAEGYFVFKVFDDIYKPPKYWDIRENSFIEEEVNYNRTEDCACGIHFCNKKSLRKRNAWLCKLHYLDLSTLVVPYASTGSARCGRLQLIKKIDPVNFPQYF